MRTVLITAATWMLAIAAVSAQPSFTESNLPQAGLTLDWTAADTTDVTVGPSGSGVTWDFSQLTATGETTTITYTEPANSPYAAAFPSATLAEQSDTAWSYYQLAGGRWTRLGERSEAFESGQWENPLDMALVPWAYQQEMTDDAKHTFSVNGTVVNRNAVIRATYDGYGTLILPQGTFQNVIRIAYEQTVLDSSQIVAGPVTIGTGITTAIKAWTWHQAGNPKPLLAIDTARITIITGPPANTVQTFRYPHVQFSTQDPGGSTDPVPPIALAPLDGAQIPGSAVSLQVEASSPPSMVRFQVGRDEDFTSIVADETVEGAQVDVAELELGRTYFWRAATITGGSIRKQDGQVQAQSAWTSVRTFTMVPPAPMLLSPLDNSTLDSGSPLEWTPTTGKSQIQIAPSESFEELVAEAMVIESAYQVTLPEGAYHWRVRCLASNDVPGPWSPAWRFVVGPVSVSEEAGIKVWLQPSPAIDRAVLAGAHQSGYDQCRIVDAAGRVYASLSIDRDQLVVDLTALAAGPYTLLLSGKSTLRTIPLTVVR